MKSNYLIASLLLLSIFLQVQATVLLASTGDPGEKLLIVHDRELYLDGDTIWLKMISADPESGKMQSLSSTAYVEMLGRGEQLVARTKISLSDAIGCGWIIIPEGLLSGNYYLRAYTSWMKNAGPGGFAYSMVSVVNPFHPLYHSMNRIAGDTADGYSAFRSQFSEMRQAGISQKEMKLFLDMGMEKSGFRRGELVRVSIRVSDNSGRPVEAHLSASAYLADTSFVHNRDLMKKGDGSQDEVHKGKSLLHFPELAGPAVSGKVVERSSGQPAAGILVTCSSREPVSQFQVFRTGPDGSFRFVPREDRTTIDLVINVPDQHIPREVLLDDPYSDQYMESSLPVLQLDERVQKYIEQLSVNKQVMGQYKKPVQPSVESDKYEKGFFYGAPSETVDLEDYIRLPVMEEIFRELVKTVILYRSGGEMKLGIIDAFTNNIIGENPLVLLDGIPLAGHRELLGLDPSLLRFIRVVDSRFFVGEMELDGIIDLESAHGDYRDFELPPSVVRYRFRGASGPCPDRGAAGDAAVAPETGDHQPDFRTLLYWNPEFSTGADDHTEISFRTPDVTGTYQLVVEGISGDGARGRALLRFEVE